MYTDGSMSSVCDDHEFSCHINASICTAELLAIEAAIEYIWGSNDEEFMVITHLLLSLQALESQKLNNPIVSNILHLCHYLSRHKDIVFCWVPSHFGILGNDRADVLAKAALDKTILITFCKVNGTSMSPVSCLRYNQSLSDLLHQWNVEEMMLSYAGPDMVMPISQTDIY